MPVACSHKIPQVDAYIQRSAPFAQPILGYLRELLHEAVPDVTEEIKWSRPFFLYRGVILGNISGFKHHCSFGLWGIQIAAALRSDGIASSDGMGTFGKIATLDDLPPRRELIRYIKAAATHIDNGERTKAWERPRVAKADVAVPVELETALLQNKSAAAKFAAMSPSCRREYSEWIGSAKREQTRSKRVATAIEGISEGKPRNWQYQ